MLYKISLENPAAPGGNLHWRVRTYYIHDGGSGKYLTGDSGTASEHVNSCEVQSSAVVTNYWPQMYHQTGRTRTEEYGPLVFHFESNFDLLGANVGDYIKL